jgi:hypothetical protein
MNDEEYNDIWWQAQQLLEQQEYEETQLNKDDDSGEQK